VICDHPFVAPGSTRTVAPGDVFRMVRLFMDAGDA
jgi:hypothetical protein